MVAQLLHESGLFLGSADQLLGGNAGNQEGHFEHLGFFQINEALLRRFGASWEVPPELKPGWERDPSLEELRAEARALVETFSGKAPWGWKEPRTTLLLPFWKSLVPSLRFVICVRSPLDVAKSLAKRDKLTVERGVILWRRYTRAAIKNTDGCPRLFAFYDDFFANPAVETDRLFRFCGLPRSEAASALDSIIRGDLRHHRSELAELLKDRSVPTEYKLIYLGLRALQDRDSAWAGSEDTSAQSATHLMQLLDEFHDAQRLAQLQGELTEERDEVSRLRKELYEDLRAKHRWAYRVYRNFIRPFRTRQP